MLLRSIINSKFNINNRKHLQQQPVLRIIVPVPFLFFFGKIWMKLSLVNIYENNLITCFLWRTCGCVCTRHQFEYLFRDLKPNLTTITKPILLGSSMRFFFFFFFACWWCKRFRHLFIWDSSVYCVRVHWLQFEKR